MLRGDANNQATTHVGGQSGIGDRNIPVKIASYTGRFRNAMVTEPAAGGLDQTRDKLDPATREQADASPRSAKTKTAGSSDPAASNSNL